MSIFRETFPQFIIDELDRRQDGMLARDPKFIHQLNTRNAWVRMTSGVNYEGSNSLAKKYVLQGGTLNNNTSLRSGLGGDGASAYDRISPGGNALRLGIRPMPGITGVSIQSKGAYGSLQEATVSFIAWDIRQLEELEILYMRPGYTVLLEFGWNYVTPIPKYNILDIAADTGVSLQEAFADIYQKITNSKGNYDALLGYVKNYNWSAREDGGYDCTTTIISLGEVLESLKCNWIPMETKAFTKTSILGPLFGITDYNTETQFRPDPYYQRGIIPGLISELFYYMDSKANPLEGSLSYSRALKDPNYNSTYHLYMSKRLGVLDKFDRGGLTKHLGSQRVEGYITLGSFCELLNNYVLLTNGNKGKSNLLSQVTTYETDANGVTITEKDKFNNDIPKSLLCLASPLSISTNYGICFVRNENWKNLGVQDAQTETEEDRQLTQAVTVTTPADIRAAISAKNFRNLYATRIQPNISEVNNVFKYNGNLIEDLKNIAKDLATAITKVGIVEVTKDGKNSLIPKFIFLTGNEFNSTLSPDIAYDYVNFLDYFHTTTTKTSPAGYSTATYEVLAEPEVRVSNAYQALFGFLPGAASKNIFIGGREYTPPQLVEEVKKAFTKVSLTEATQQQLDQQVSAAAQAIGRSAEQVPGLTSETLPFLVPNSSVNTKSLGYLSNIYVNMDFLFDQAISKNVSSNDNQGKNTISIREYIQNIVRQIQNSLGNINDFDLQVDNRNAVGRIIDINFTGDSTIDPFTIQIHNTNSIVRNYNFQSKIFPEMGSIIAISAQDATGIGKLGYDNATLVAWNENIKDRLVPKKDFNVDISLGNTNDPSSFLLPFLTKLYTYFEALDGKGTNNANLSYGGLDFAYRDFLSNLKRFDPQNKFSAIIPTEISITLDGIGGIVIGNLFQINQDIVPKAYRGKGGRRIAYIVTKLGHSIQNNDWTTTLSAYPIVLEPAESVQVWRQWKGQQYPGTVTVLTGADGQPIASFQSSDQAKLPTNSAIPVIRYLKGLGRQNGQLLTEDLSIINQRITTNNTHQLFPSAARQWEKLILAAQKAGFKISDIAISDITGASYRSFANQQATFAKYGKEKAATPGTSVHGWGAAVDIQSLYTATGGSVNPTINANIRNSNALYKWLNTNAAAYGWINPPQLKDGVNSDEAWHWEYWGPVSGGAIGEAEKTVAPQGSDARYIAELIKQAASGLGTDEQGLINAINLIKDKKMFAEVNKIINIEKIFNEELGTNDINTLKTLQTSLAKIGVTLNYSTVRGIVQDSIKTTIKF
jgi:LAS superfamily LD-carboxypeptidase LdcB